MLLTFAAAAWSATWTVEEDGRGDFSTLAEAASVAAAGDTIVIGDGTWAGASFTRQVRVKGKNGAAATTIDGQGFVAIYAAAGLDLEGLTITSAGITSTVLVGGGSVTDVVFANSGTAWTSYGGALQLGYGSFTIDSSTFTANYAYQGGALYIYGEGSAVEVSSSSFEDGYAAEGGAIIAEAGTSLSISDSTFSRNIAYYHGGAVYAPGAAGVTSSRSTYTSNEATTGWGGGIYVGNEGSYTGTSDTFDTNVGVHGGGVSLYYATLDAVENTYTDNVVSGLGGALLLYVAPGEDTDSTYTNNRSTGYYGGAVHVDDAVTNFTRPTFTGNSNTSGYGGGALSVYDAGQSTISGATFTNNSAVGPGGGLYVYSGAQVVLTDSTFEGNTGSQGAGIGVSVGSTLTSDGNHYLNNAAAAYGGAMAVDTLSSLIESSAVYEDNTAYYYGGSLYTYDRVSIVEDHCTFEDGTATYGNGGHLYLSYAGSASFADCAITGGVSYYGGGAFYVYSLSDGGVTLTRSTVDGNTATYGSGGGLQVTYASQLVLDTVNLTNNTAYGGGGLAVTGTVPTTIVNSTISDNAATLYSGGGVSWDAGYTQDADFLLRDSVVSGNLTEESGAGLYVSYPDQVDIVSTLVRDNIAGPAAFGGGLMLREATGGVRVNNSQFIGNEAGYGGGFYQEGQEALDIDDVWSNLIVAGNSAMIGGGACFVRGVASEAHHLSVVGNAAADKGGGVCMVENVLTLTDSVVAETTAGAALHAFDAQSASGFTFPYGALYGNGAGDAGGELTSVVASVTADPSFVAWTNDGVDNDSFVLASASPLRDAADPATADPDGSRADIGAWGGPGLLVVDADGDGVDSASDCDDTDPAVYPGAADAWYDGVDSDCAGNADDDQDGDGLSLDDDCDDTDPALGADCSTPEPTDTGDSGRGGTTEKPDCGCGHSPAAGFAATALLLVSARRRVSR